MIRVQQLKKSFGAVEVLKSIDAEILTGEFFTLLGASGCGKTTLLRCIAGLEEPSSGRILFGDTDVTARKPWERNVGFVFQNYALWPHLTVLDNVAYGLRMRKTPRNAVEERVREVLKIVNLPGLERRFPGQLSGGQQQRVAIARALVFNPQVLLFDEPLSNLDTKLRERMRRDIRELQKRLGITSIYVTHDQEEALELSDRIAVMEDGRIRQTGSPVEIYETPADPFTAGFVGTSNFLEGRLQDGHFVTTAGLELPSPDRPDWNGEAVLCIRPESIVFVTESPGALPVDVTGSAYLGSTRQLTARLSDGTVVTIDSRERLAPGQKAWVRFDACRFFPRRRP